MGSEEGEDMDVVMDMETPILVTCQQCEVRFMGTISTCQPQTSTHYDETGHIFFIVALQIME